MNTIAVQNPRQSLRLLILILAACLVLARPIAGHASTPASRYHEALSQVSHQQVSINHRVQTSIEIVQGRFPGAILAACAPTGSMTPTLDENYLAVLEDCSFRQLRRGEIILTRLGSEAMFAAVMHRIVGSPEMGCLQTQGDAINHADPVYTTSFNYLGKRVVAAIHLQTGAISWLADAKPTRPSRRLTQK